jgi:hypothetical protein
MVVSDVAFNVDYHLLNAVVNCMSITPNTAASHAATPPGIKYH